ncbi:MAG TPA: MurR/RpiR family transcriptional regulator [Inquilinus sp.]
MAGTEAATVESAPDSFEALRGAIAARYPALSKRLKTIAEFALAHPDVIALETVAVIAAKAEVQPSALVRFAQALGFDGFSEMQRLFRAQLVERMPSYEARIRTLDARFGGAETSSGPLNAFIDISVGALERLRGDVDPAVFARAVDILARADCIHLAAQRRSFPIAVYLSYLLAQLDRPVHLLDNFGGMLAEQSRAIRPGDALFVVTFRSYAPDVQEVARRARAAGVPIVAITDSDLSPVYPIADACFVVHEGEIDAFRSLSATPCLALTLAVALGRRHEAQEG